MSLLSPPGCSKPRLMSQHPPCGAGTLARGRLQPRTRRQVLLQFVPTDYLRRLALGLFVLNIHFLGTQPPFCEEAPARWRGHVQVCWSTACPSASASDMQGRKSTWKLANSQPQLSNPQMFKSPPASQVSPAESSVIMEQERVSPLPCSNS